MTPATRLFEHTDWLLLLLRLLLVGLAIALALAPSLAGGTSTLGQASGSQTALMGSGPADVVAWVTSLAAPAVQTDGLLLEQAGGLFIQGDMVDGACTPRGRYAPGERVVFRVRVINAETNEMARDATVAVHLADGTVLPMRFSGHPASSSPTDEFWATSWTVPAETPPGVVRFTVEAVDGPLTGRFQPFNVESSLLTIVEAP
jgi:hypothetical protein